MATTVKITETYDLKTTVNKLGVIGIHTPTDSQIRNLYPGLMKNHKFIRFLKCDVVGACASVLPADPLQVGVSAGEIAPEDMFNPILYKAVTNESFDNMVNMIYQGTRPGALGSVSKDEIDSSIDSFKIYYALLSENGRFRKSMPQSGFSIRGLVPICHTLISTYGQVVKTGNKAVLAEDGENTEFVSNVADVSEVTNAFGALEGHQAVTFRGRSVRMPKIPLHYAIESLTDTYTINIPETFVACLIIPPAKLHEFYYRMRVTWTIRFEEPCSNASLAGAGGMQTLGGTSSYYKGYTFSKSEADLPEKETSVDADGVSIEKIMES